MDPEIIEHLAQARAIEPEYTDARGTKAFVTQQVKQKILAAMGYPMDDELALIDAINHEAESHWLTVAEPVTVVTQTHKVLLSFKLPIDYVNDELTLNILQQDKTVACFTFIPVDSQLVAAVEIREVEIQQYDIEIDLALKMGYYDFELIEAGIEEPLGQGRLIIAPDVCYLPQTLKQDKETADLKAQSIQVNPNSKLSCQSLTISPPVKMAISNDDGELSTEKSECRVDASIGLPPDVQAPQGENWRVPAIDPLKLYQQGYQPIIASLRLTMPFYDVLQLDHIMSLFKQWWIPAGESAKDGAYIDYPADELLAILALESHLHSCLIIIQNVAGVPEDIVTKLQQRGIFSRAASAFA